MSRALGRCNIHRQQARPLHLSSSSPGSRWTKTGTCCLTPSSGVLDYSFDYYTRTSKRYLSSKPLGGHLDSRWQSATARLLDRQALPLGSLDSLQWQLAQMVLLYWVEQGAEGVTKTFHLLDRLIEEASVNADPNAKLFSLDIYLLHAVLKNWNRCFKKFQVNLLPSELLQKLDDYMEKAPNCFEPNIATYTMILDGAAHCPNPSERLVFTEMLLERLMQESQTNALVRPTVVTFSTVINAWAHTGSSKAAEKAQALLHQVQELHNQGWPDVKPNTVMYTAAINAWANAGNAERADLLLQQMYQEYAMEHNQDVKPGIRTFNTVLSAWSKSFDQDSLEHAQALLLKMRELYESGLLDCNPNVVSYNNLLQNLSKQRNNPQAVEKAESYIQEMIQLATTTTASSSCASGKNDTMPNEISLTALIKTIAGSSNHPDRAKRAKHWVTFMADYGIPSNAFIKDQVRNMEQQTKSGDNKSARQTKSPLPAKKR
jgi:hypothetical protein